ncbi:MAG TPA: cytochrome c oxidase assembly protein [Rhodopila sp.]|uniref:cytochrome c oxidase assembly protein n=1 Tax=Rhodopila sp. TaxID=2480087 RepID=UPI002BD7F657|nr:cytochrome c oxidase assembly protein [Rhodopila sp.]HVY13922.1 cytochrome c oxidase assembly protein [Rhodopila sp.]
MSATDANASNGTISTGLDTRSPRLRLGRLIADPSARLATVVIVVGAVLAWLANDYPADIPAFLPWDFYWTDYLCIAFPLAWYLRGLWLTPAGQRPHAMRRIAFLTGVALIYAVTQTRFVYFAQHMFFLNRIQQLGMHHIGPVLVALGWPGDTIARGMPAFIHRIIRARWLQSVMRVLQQPVVAGFIFVGLLALWVDPAVHFPAMISPVLYDTMNLTMVIDGLLFWFLILDPRPVPQAAHSYATRLVTVILVCFPEMIIGAALSFTTTSLYAYYDLCGRLIPSIGALQDQHIGGVVIWIPGSLISSAAFMIIMIHLRVQEDKAVDGKHRDDIVLPSGARVSSASWTGRA